MHRKSGVYYLSTYYSGDMLDGNGDEYGRCVIK